MTLSDLISKLEGVTEGSRELDALVMITAAAVPEPEGGIAEGWSWRPEAGYSDFRRDHTVCRRAIRPDGTVHSHGFGSVTPPQYTTSADAALTLVPDGWELNSITALVEGWGVDLTAPGSQFLDAVGKTIPLALCLASLRTRQSLEIG